MEEGAYIDFPVICPFCGTNLGYMNVVNYTGDKTHLSFSDEIDVDGDTAILETFCTHRLKLENDVAVPDVVVKFRAEIPVRNRRLVFNEIEMTISVLKGEEAKKSGATIPLVLKLAAVSDPAIDGLNDRKRVEELLATGSYIENLIE